MFAVGWGERAVELMARASVRGGTGIERAGAPASAGARAGELAVIGAAGASDGHWRCWISGRLTNAGELRERFGLPPGAHLAALWRAPTRGGALRLRAAAGDVRGGGFRPPAPLATVVRDHLGGRPLVHIRVGDGALFAEHERTLVDLLPSTPSPDRLALARWIERGSTPPGRTLFEGILRIPPAHRVELSCGAIAVAPYWRPRYTRPPPARGRRSPNVCEKPPSRRWRAPPMARAARGTAQRGPRLLLRGGGVGARGQERPAGGARVRERRAAPVEATPAEARGGPTAGRWHSPRCSPTTPTPTSGG